MAIDKFLFVCSFVAIANFCDIEMKRMIFMYFPDEIFRNYKKLLFMKTNNNFAQG